MRRVEGARQTALAPCGDDTCRAAMAEDATSIALLHRAAEACRDLSRAPDDALKRAGLDAVRAADGAIRVAQARLAAVLASTSAPGQQGPACAYTHETVQSAVEEAMLDGTFPDALDDVLEEQVGEALRHGRHAAALQMLSTMISFFHDGALDELDEYDPEPFLHDWTARADAAIAGLHRSASKDEFLRAVGEVAGAVAACEPHNFTHSGLVRVQSKCVRFIENDGELGEDDDSEEDGDSEEDDESQEEEDDEPDMDFIGIDGDGDLINLAENEDSEEDSEEGEEGEEEEEEEEGGEGEPEAGAVDEAGEEEDDEEEGDEEEDDEVGAVEGHVAKRART